MAEETLRQPISERPPPTTRVPRWLRGFGFLCLLFLLSILGAGLTVTLFGSQTYRWRAFEVRLSIQPALYGETRLVFTPLGEVRAATHQAPLAFHIGLQNVSLDGVKKLLMKPPPKEELESELRAEMRRILLQFSLRLLLVGALGGLLAPLFLRVKQARFWLLAPVFGGAFVVVVYFVTLRTFDGQAFHSPRYTGSLQQADWVIKLVREAFNKANTLSDRLRHIAGDINRLYGRINTLESIRHNEDAFQILHISDIHNNPAAVDFVLELAERFQVKMVIDTGDLTDFGSPLEIRLTSGLAKLKVPYVFVAGNHDSLETVEAVRRELRGITLQGQPVTIEGLRLLGIPDPISLRQGPGSVDTSPESIEAARSQLQTLFDQTKPQPHIVCVHNPHIASALAGKARLILCGHMHRASLEEQEGTILCNAGTTGAAGLRYLDRVEGVPLTAAILTISRSTPPKLLAIDVVGLSGDFNEYTITRRTFNLPLAEDQPLLNLPLSRQARSLREAAAQSR
jgi:predicted phosphodiesterase